MGSLNGFKNTGGPRNFPVLLILCILTNAIQRTTARDEPTTTDTTATADRRSRDSSLCTNMLYLARENALQSRDCIANSKNNITCNIQANMASTSV